MPPVTVPDLREPHAPMLHKGIRLPAPLVEQLAHQAALIGCSPAALTRALVARGSREVAAALAADQETIANE